MFVPGYTEDEARAAVAASLSYSEVLRNLGLRPAGGNHKLLRHWVDVWQISTAHFDPWAGRSFPPNVAKPLSEILVENSTYHRGHLKHRLYNEGIKSRACELCGQDELWHGAVMALILDHINGIPTDNRLENLRIVCANCAATLDTHCGRNRKLEREPRVCLHCGKSFWPKAPTRRYCSASCGTHSRPKPGPRPATRKVQRPSYEQLQAELAASSFVAVGRRYGVSDNAVRKWLRAYEREAEEGAPGAARDQNE